MGFVFLRVVLFLPAFSIFLCLGFLMFFDVRGWKSLRVPMQRSSASSISWRQMPSRCHQQPISNRKTNHCHGSHGTPQDLKMCESHSVIKCFCSWSICFRATRTCVQNTVTWWPWILRVSNRVRYRPDRLKEKEDLLPFQRVRDWGCDWLRRAAVVSVRCGCCSLAVQPMFGLKDSWADEKLEPRRATPKHRDIQRPI